MYENGDIYGGFAMTKNMYNALYTVDMPDDRTMASCRTYCGIQNSQNGVLLKYYDDLTYSMNGQDEMDLTATAGTPDMVPYQKVELYRP